MVRFTICGDDIKGFTVGATEAGLVGAYRDGKPYSPNNDEVRAALPYRYRKAFDRACGAWWFNGDSAHVALRDYRGAHLVTLYANPRPVLLAEGDRVRYSESFCAETSTTEAGRVDCARRRGVVTRVFGDGKLCDVDWDDYSLQFATDTPSLVREV